MVRKRPGGEGWLAQLSGEERGDGELRCRESGMEGDWEGQRWSAGAEDGSYKGDEGRAEVVRWLGWP